MHKVFQQFSPEPITQLPPNYGVFCSPTPWVKMNGLVSKMGAGKAKTPGKAARVRALCMTGSQGFFMTDVTEARNKNGSNDVNGF